MLSFMRILVLVNTLLTLTLAGAAVGKEGDDSERTATLEQLLDAARMEISDVQAARDAVAADPGNLVAVTANQSVITIDRRDVEAGITLAAALAHEIVSSSPTAASMVNDVIGSTVGSSLEGFGVNSDIADLVGSFAGQAIEAVGAEVDLLTEDRLREQIAMRVRERLDGAALTLEQLDAEIAIRWQLYDAIEAALTGVDEVPGAPVVGAGPISDGNWHAELATVVEDRNDGLVVRPLGDGLTAYFDAPPSYHGDWRGRAQITFERMSEGGQYYGAFEWGGDGDVVIASGAMKASFVIDSDHSGGWGSFTVPLDGAGWILDGGGSFDEILADVTEFRIRAEYGAGADMSGLRNVVLD